MKYLITNGKLYVKENLNGEFTTTTNETLGTLFNFKRAKGLIKSKDKKYKWLKNYYIEDFDTKEIINFKAEKEKAKELISDKKIEFDESLLDEINLEATSIIGLAAYEKNDLVSKQAILNQALSFYDLAISDATHIIAEESPQAHIRTKIYGVLQELEQKRKDIKQAMQYIDVMMKALENNWDISKLKSELIKVKYVPYKGRTYIYEMIMNMVYKN